MGSCATVGRYVVQEGAAVSVKDINGRVVVHHGPQSIWRSGKEIRSIQRYVVTDVQFAVLTFYNGQKEFKRGPCIIWEDPVNIRNVNVKNLLVVKRGAAVVVFEKDGGQTIIQGPATVCPEDKRHQVMQEYVSDNNSYLRIQYLNGKKEFVDGPTRVFFDRTKHREISIRKRYQIKEGERAALWELDGSINIVDGPKSIVVGDRKIEKVPLYTACEREYLRVKYHDGRKTHLKGPCAKWMDPTTMIGIEIKDAHVVTGGEVIIIYSTKDMINRGENLEDVDEEEMKKKPVTKRRVLKGPTLYVPDPDEWLHIFSWHGSTKKGGRGENKVPHQLKFTNLRITPDQFYYNVKGVRTADDALLVVKVMIFFELRDLEQMLNNTLDPIGDFINAVTGDVISFATRLSYDLFVEKTGSLNDLKTYPQLVENAKKIGYTVTKVVYRGYDSSAELEKMHTHHIEQRTKLRLDKETEEKEQDLQDLVLMKELERSKRSMKMEREKKAHELEMDRNDHTEKIVQMKNENDEEFRKLQSMKNLGVKLTTYLIEEKRKQPGKLIQISNNGNRGNALKVDLK